MTPEYAVLLMLSLALAATTALRIVLYVQARATLCRRERKPAPVATPPCLARRSNA